MTSAKILGIGASLPSTSITNDMLADRLATSDEWIQSRTGIAARRWVGRGQSTADLAVAAGRLALRSADVSGVDAVLLATTTPDRPCPATAPEVAARLGLGSIPAYDVAAVCTGFLYGLASAVGLIAAGSAGTVLLIGADTFSSIIDPDDRSTGILFGDGAGAVVLGPAQPGEPGEIGPCVLGSDGSLAHLIEIPAGGSRQRLSGQPTNPADHYFRMSGREVFRIAVDRMSEVAVQAVARAGLSIDDVDALVPHQANQRISAAVAKRLDLEQGKLLSNVATLGNTAAASIPVLLAEAGGDGRIKAEDRLLLVAFGGGLTWGGVTLTWPDVTPECDLLPTCSA
jgi:3-oxoacyl-[acyl-carrier-protein] synthase-3